MIRRRATKIPFLAKSQKKQTRRRVVNPLKRKPVSYPFRRISNIELGRIFNLHAIAHIEKAKETLDREAQRVIRKHKVVLEAGEWHANEIFHLSNTDHSYIPGMGYKILENFDAAKVSRVVFYNPFSQRTFIRTVPKRVLSRKRSERHLPPTEE
ncbi:MAG: hypothetical protein IPJ89_03280 [Candidatus Iainarchaeum archaeon]|uniref:Uncharacterized protein n=1 Tax=Candidatus Iainarchaeum sp. TaxID=3101447 RepID=A0A7T9DIX4_9ARCH|nr:MAG: hypothetical protein IPJ89_03280 [Candidatus Diapherotrites archaeon]